MELWQASESMWELFIWESVYRARMCYGLPPLSPPRTYPRHRMRRPVTYSEAPERMAGGRGKRLESLLDSLDEWMANEDIELPAEALDALDACRGRPVLSWRAELVPRCVRVYLSRSRLQYLGRGFQSALDDAFERGGVGRE